MKRYSVCLLLALAILSIGCSTQRNIVGKTLRMKNLRKYCLQILTDSTARYFEANSSWRDIDTVRWEYLDKNTIRLWRDFTHLNLPLTVMETTGYSSDSLYFILPRENYHASIDSVFLYINGKSYWIDYNPISSQESDSYDVFPDKSPKLPPCIIDYDEQSATCQLLLTIPRCEIGDLREIYLTAAVNPERYIFHYTHRPLHDYIRSASYVIKKPANNVYHIALSLPYGTIKGGFFYRDWDRIFTLAGCRKRNFISEKTFFFDETDIIYDWSDINVPFGFRFNEWIGYEY